MNAPMKILVCFLLASAVASCSGEKERETGSPAAGEVLKGSISDDMLPYDTLRSQPPLASDAPDEGANTDGDEGAPARDGADPGPGSSQVPADEGAEQSPPED